MTNTPPQRRWVLATENPEDTAPAEAWAADLEVSPLTVQLMWRRGLRTKADMDVFLSPGLRHLEHPHNLPGVEDAARTLAKGLERCRADGSAFAVWGDYDVDGVSATALVLDVLEARGISALYHIPRREDGYGVSVVGIERLAEDGVTLLMTVDCGISDLPAMTRAKELGMTVVLTDHHLPGAELPTADAIVNPRTGPDPDASPFRNLSGVGVAFLVMAALNKLLPGEPMDIRQVLDLVALGTLADIVDVRGQNRILVKNGLLLVADPKRPGLRALKEAAGMPVSGAVTAGKVGFQLGPRINAAGRMDTAETALKLLRATDLATARELAGELEKLNDERRAEEERITAEALEQVKAHPERMGLALKGDDWHPGVVGIVAARVAEASQRPALILSTDGDQLKGSGRSVPGVDLHKSLGVCAPLLKGFGGHPMAAGLSLAPERFDELCEAFHQAVSAQLDGEVLVRELKVDAELDFSRVNLRLIKELELLQPFGPGNPEPVFQCSHAEVRNMRIFAERHVNLELRDTKANVTLTAKAWRMAEHLPMLPAKSALALAFTPKLSSFRGLDRIELQVKDLKLEREKPEETASA